MHSHFTNDTTDRSQFNDVTEVELNEAELAVVASGCGGFGGGFGFGPGGGFGGNCCNPCCNPPIFFNSFNGIGPIGGFGGGFGGFGGVI